MSISKNKFKDEICHIQNKSSKDFLEFEKFFGMHNKSDKISRRCWRKEIG